MKNYNCIVVLGPTASGKTHLACKLAYYLNGEIISADSRQVYRDLNIGTGKDLNEYTINGKHIPYYLIDVIYPEEQFYLHQFIAGLKTAFDTITAKSKIPIICGGTGLYLDALRKDFSFTQINENAKLREELKILSKEELQKKLSLYKDQELKHVDLNSKKRMIRAIEIAEHFRGTNNKMTTTELPYRPYYIGISVSVEKRRELIYNRLTHRLNNGLVEEVEALLQKGISHERLQFLGLEYKFVSNFLQSKISKEELILRLSTAINQFSKRQMTWFRKMEKEGVEIHWVHGNEDMNQIVQDLRTF